HLMLLFLSGWNDVAGCDHLAVTLLGGVQNAFRRRAEVAGDNAASAESGVEAAGGEDGAVLQHFEVGATPGRLANDARRESQHGSHLQFVVVRAKESERPPRRADHAP